MSHEKGSNLYQPFVCLDALALLVSWLLSAEIQFVHAFIGSMSYFNRGNTEGTNSSEKFCLMFVYVFCTFVSGLIWLFLDNLWFDDLLAG